MVGTRFIVGYVVRREIRCSTAFFLGLYGIMLVAGGIPVWEFSIFSGAGLLDGLLWLWCFLESLTVTWNAMGYLTAIKRLQRNHAVIYSSYCGHIYIRLGIADAGNSHVRSSSDCSGCGIRSDAFVGCDPFVSVFPQGEKGCLPFSKMGGSVSASGIYRFFFINIGLFAHLVIMWVGPLQVQVGTVCWCTLP